MTVTTATPAFARPRLDVGLAFKNGWNAFTADIVPLLVGALIAGILSVITLGILAGPLTAGSTAWSSAASATDATPRSATCSAA